MDHLFSPWRYRYVREARTDSAGCVLCAELASGSEEENLIVLRAQFNAVMLNRFPYTSGHMMILPLVHAASLTECSVPARAELMELAVRAEQALRTEYQAQGINIGLNLGMAAGAGIAGHLHLHVVPRWQGDANFMTVIGETRVLPEELPETSRRLRRALAATAPSA